MKKFVLSTLALAALVVIYSDAYAYAVNPHITVAPNVVTATVANPYPRPIVCSGYAFGRSAYSGQVFNSWMNSIVIYPGGFYNLHVFNQWEPFANGWASIQCRWY